MDIVTTARRAGAYSWAEASLFTTLGTWLHTLSDPSVIEYLGERCTRHGERAEAWAARVAAIPVVERDAAIAPSAPIDSAAFTSLAAADGDDARHRDWYDVVAAQLYGLYTQHREDLDPLVDGPTARLLDRILGER